MFQPPDDMEEVPSEQFSMFLQGYSSLLSACKIEDEIPDEVKVTYLRNSLISLYSHTSSMLWVGYG